MQQASSQTLQILSNVDKGGIMCKGGERGMAQRSMQGIRVSSLYLFGWVQSFLDFLE